MWSDLIKLAKAQSTTRQVTPWQTTETSLSVSESPLMHTHPRHVSPLLSTISRSSLQDRVVCSACPIPWWKIPGSPTLTFYQTKKLNPPPLLSLYKHSTKAKLRDKTLEQSFSGSTGETKLPNCWGTTTLWQSAVALQFAGKTQAPQSKANINMNWALRKSNKWAQLEDYRPQETVNGLQRLSPAGYCSAQIHTRWKFSPDDNLLVVCLE